MRYVCVCVCERKMIERAVCSSYLATGRAGISGELIATPRKTKKQSHTKTALGKKEQRFHLLEGYWLL